MTATKPPNPKDALGVRRAPMSTLPGPVLLEMGVALLEGACKYGRHNYRAVGVRASVYFDAAMRHLWAWWEGEDIDPDSGLSHVTKALSCLAVLRDAQLQGMCTDDRPPSVGPGWVAEATRATEALLARHPDPKQPFTRDGEWAAAGVKLDACRASDATAYEAATRRRQDTCLHGREAWYCDTCAHDREKKRAAAHAAPPIAPMDTEPTGAGPQPRAVSAEGTNACVRCNAHSDHLHLIGSIIDPVMWMCDPCYRAQGGRTGPRDAAPGR